VTTTHHSNTIKIAANPPVQREMYKLNLENHYFGSRILNTSRDNNDEDWIDRNHQLMGINNKDKYLSLRIEMMNRLMNSVPSHGKSTKSYR